MSLARFFSIAKKAYASLPARFLGGWAFPPFHYQLEVTRRCNLRCKMCQYIHWLTAVPSTKQGDGELTTEEWKQVIQQISRFSLITFTGGEPWVRSDFAEILAYASRRHRTHFISNGTLLNEERARLCVEMAPHWTGGAGLNFIGISIDGDAPTHNQIRGLPDAFEKSTQGIRLLTQYKQQMKKKAPHIHVTTVIQKDSLALLPRMPRIIRELGADILNLTLEIRYQDALTAQEIPDAQEIPVITPMIPADELRNALQLTRLAAQEAQIELRLPRMPEEQIIRYYEGKMNIEQFVCPTLWTTLFVGRKGDVFPCFFCKPANVREYTLREIRNNPDIKAFRNKHAHQLSPLCKGCCELQYKINSINGFPEE